ncbi:MAG TPA: FAD:protein FMN transferase, partial [Thermomicrobiaceae bacterium]|nr:FAD:protein FMN transferase [Thermomicrobiaceae bacterium]
MQQRRLVMGMPVTVEILDPGVAAADLDAVYAYFGWVDATFSTYDPASEVSRLNRGELTPDRACPEVRAILALAEETKALTQGYFDIRRDGVIDPSGIVKGWAIQQAAERLAAAGWHDFYVDAGGDVQVSGTKAGRPWRVGIRNPFQHEEVVKVLALTDRGVATSGTAVRGQHIYDPFRPGEPLTEVLSLTVVGPNVYEADRFATAAFAMGRRGI